jgi:hypothetical protein
MPRNSERRLLILFAVVFVPNLVSYLLGQFGYDLTWMWASRSTPWGVITANFVPPDLEDFVGNMVLLGLFAWGFGIVNKVCGGNGLRRSEVLLAAAAFLSSILAISFLLVLGGHGSGASGVVYATAGFTWGFVLVRRHCAKEVLLRRRNISRVNWYVLFVGLVASPVAAVFGGGNLVVHLTSYMLGGLIGAEIGRRADAVQRKPVEVDGG